MSRPAPSPPPELGQLVNVRSGRWVVQDVRAGTLPPPALKPGFSGPQHLLTLSSVEDDALGEELRVIWEIEPGAKVPNEARQTVNRRLAPDGVSMRSLTSSAVIRPGVEKPLGARP
jgi:hypothetical protein